jgi:hypothetical protein
MRISRRKVSIAALCVIVLAVFTAYFGVEYRGYTYKCAICHAHMREEETTVWLIPVHHSLTAWEMDKDSVYDRYIGVQHAHIYYGGGYATKSIGVIGDGWHSRSNAPLVDIDKAKLAYSVLEEANDKSMALTKYEMAQKELQGVKKLEEITGAEERLRFHGILQKKVFTK